MGLCFSRTPHTKAVGGELRPQIFAIMRNGHEVLRGAMVECRQALELEDPKKAVKAFAAAWRDYSKWHSTHARMEDGDSQFKGFFKTLDEEFEGVATSEGLTTAHEDLEDLERAVAEAVATKDLDKIKSAYAAFSEANENHMKHEEEVMMPKVQELAQQGKAKDVMITHVLPLATAGDMTFFVGFAMRILEKHHGGNPRARVFAHALQAAATDKQWARWRKIVRRNLTAEAYAKMKEEIDV